MFEKKKKIKINMVTMVFTFIKSNICNNWTLFCAAHDIHEEIWTI